MKNLNIDHITFAALNVILIILGIIGSVSIFVAICISKELKSTTSMIVANLAAVDLMVSVSCIFSMIGK